MEFILAKHYKHLIESISIRKQNFFINIWKKAVSGFRTHKAANPHKLLGDMLENDQFPPKWSFSSMSPRVAKGRQGLPRSKGDPRDG